MDNLEAKAATLYKAQKYPEALDIYLSLYKKSPKTEKYSIYCGNCFDAMGNNDQALHYYKRATKLNPVSQIALNALANIYYSRGDYVNSEKFTLKILETNPQDISALLNMGNIAYCRSEYSKALDFYETVYRLNPSSYIAVINMANTCYDLERFVKALDYAKRALELYPSSIDAYIILGNSYLELGRVEKAEKNLLRALEYRQDNPWIYTALSRLYQKSENWEQALRMGWNAVLYAGEAQEDQHINFGYLLYECVDETNDTIAVNYAKKWFERFSSNKMVCYMAQAILNDHLLDKADQEYVEKIFDQFASDFEETLAGLEYQVPEYIAELIRKTYKKPLGLPCNWLDIGCGTGLCGQAAKSIVGWSRLDGLDISPKMLEKAKQKGIYDHLYHDEIIHFLNANRTKYHLMTAGDVLTYFGDLRKLFESISLSMADNGLFIATISENSVNKESYFLLPSGRFVHTQDYLMNILKKTGFELIEMEHKPLRNEGDRVVYGWVIAVRKIMTIAK